MLLAAAGLLAATSAAGQAPAPAEPAKPAPPKNLLKIAPLGWVHGQLPFSTESRISYERVLGGRSSVGGSYSYLGTNYPFSFIGSFALSAAISSAVTLSGHPAVVWTDAKVRTTGSRYQLQYRYYFTRKQHAPEGFYLGPNFSYASADYRVSFPDFNTSFTITQKNTNYNLLVGYQNVLGRHFVLDVFTGLGHRDKDTKVYDQNGGLLTTMPKGTALKLSSGLNLGWAF
ncbi:hypothetical protein GCM10022406_29010 [Hymenobacter algoricola]|uniref:DUF3575 domain-containing protein n=1 Tax=Hymenobacter algoricola TaxID=486267 RepID=A0ABP7NI19_9BACT